MIQWLKNIYSVIVLQMYKISSLRHHNYINPEFSEFKD